MNSLNILNYLAVFSIAFTAVLGCSKKEDSSTTNEVAPEPGIQATDTVLQESPGSPVMNQRSTPDQAQVIPMEPFHGPNVTEVTHYGNCQWLYPLDEPNETLISEPSYGSEDRVYYAARYGDAEDNVYTFVLDEKGGTGTGHNTLYADLNNDNRIDSRRESFSVVQSGRTTREKRPVTVTLQVQAAGKCIPYAFEFTFFAYKAENDLKEKFHATCRNSTITVGRAEFQGKRCKIAIADLDSNGLYGDYEMGIFNGDRFFVDLNGDGDFRSSRDKPEEAEDLPYARFSKIGGDWYTVHVTPDGGTVTISPSKPTFGTLKAEECVSRISLASPEQFQSLILNRGEAQALTGEYAIYSVSLQKKDGQAQYWVLGASFRRSEKHLTVTIQKGGSTQLPMLLPLTVSITPTAEAGAEKISLEATFTNKDGYPFQCPYVEQPRRERPQGGFEIRDEKGKRIDSRDFEYG